MLSAEEQDRLLRYNVLLSRTSDEPLHAQLTRSLRTLLLRHFEKDERFYTEEELASKLELSVGTVRHSLNRLVEEGLLERHRGQGTFVQCSPQDPTTGLRLLSFVNTYDSFFNSMVLRELSYRCLKRGHSLEILNPGQDQRATHVLDLLQAQPANLGFIFLALEPGFVNDLIQQLQSRRLPSVNIDTWLPDYPGSQIATDNNCGIRLGMQHLHELGHRRVALFLSEWPEHGNIRARIAAFKSYAQEYGLEGRIIEASPLPDFPEIRDELHLATEARYDLRIDEAAAQRVIDARVSAVFCVSDIGACMLMKRLQVLGKRIPEDISIIGFNDEGIACLPYPELTTIRQPFAAMAVKALEVLESFENSMRHIQLEPTLIVRGSTASVSHSSTAD